MRLGFTTLGEDGTGIAVGEGIDGVGDSVFESIVFKIEFHLVDTGEAEGLYCTVITLLMYWIVKSSIKFSIVIWIAQICFSLTD